MAGRHYTNAFKEKPCIVCGVIFKPTGPRSSLCSPKCVKHRIVSMGWNHTEKQYKKISGNWNRYFARLMSGAGNAERRKELSVDFLLKLLDKQGGNCALTGEPLTCILEKGKVTLTNASIDRIIPGGEYSIGNVQLVCSAVNKWRCDMPLSEYIEWCGKVYKMSGKERNFRHEYDSYHAKPEQKKRRAQRNAARKKAIDAGSVKKGDSLEVDHVNAPRTGSLENVKTRVVPKTENRKRQPKRS